MRTSFAVVAAIAAIGILSLGVVRGQERQAPEKKGAAVPEKVLEFPPVIQWRGSMQPAADEEFRRAMRGLPTHDNAGNRIRDGIAGGGFGPGFFGAMGFGQFPGPAFAPGAFGTGAFIQSRGSGFARFIDAAPKIDLKRPDKRDQ